MAVYGFAVTTKGSELLSKLMGSKGTLTLTKVEFGTGDVSSLNDKAALAAKDSLVSKLGEGTMSDPIIANGKLFVTIQYNNAVNGGVSEKKNITEYGIYAKGADSTEVLFIYGSLGDAPDVVLPYKEGGVTVIRKYQLAVTVGNIGGQSTNFSAVGGYLVSATAPTDKSVLWLDSTHNNLVKFWDGSTWKPAASTIPILSTDPANAETGEAWVKT